MAFLEVSTGLGIATNLLPLLFDSLGLAKAVMNLIKAGGDATEEDLENLRVKTDRVVERAQAYSDQWGQNLVDLRAWIDEQKGKSEGDA